MEDLGFRNGTRLTALVGRTVVHGTRVGFKTNGGFAAVMGHLGEVPARQGGRKRVC